MKVELKLERMEKDKRGNRTGIFFFQASSEEAKEVSSQLGCSEGQDNTPVGPAFLHWAQRVAINLTNSNKDISSYELKKPGCGQFQVECSGSTISPKTQSPSVFLQYHPQGGGFLSLDLSPHDHKRAAEAP